jgi:hypothetical protein
MRVALRRREKPLMADDAKHANTTRAEQRPRLLRPHRLGARGVGAHVGAALLLGHAHADDGAALLLERQRARIVFHRQDLGQPFGGDPWRLAQRRHAGVGHRQRTHAIFHLAEHQIARRPRHLGAGAAQPRRSVCAVLYQ